MTADTEDKIIMILNMGHIYFVLISIKHIHTSSLSHTYTLSQKQHVWHLFTTYRRRLIAAFHEPCNQRGRGGEEKTTITERSAVKLWSGPLPSPSIITSITSHTQSCFHVIPSPKPCSVGPGSVEKPDRSPESDHHIQQKCFSPLYFFMNFF